MQQNLLVIITICSVEKMCKDVVGSILILIMLDGINRQCRYGMNQFNQ